MNNDFENKLIAIAQSYKNKEDLKSKEEQSDPISCNYLEAIEHLFSISNKAIKIFNSESDILSSYMLPNEFLEMFLEIPGRRGGFCIISPSKVVILFDEDPNTITVIGRFRNKQSGVSQSSNKTVQLIKATFSNTKGELEYKDNTGGTIDPYDLVTLLINWVVT